MKLFAKNRIALVTGAGRGIGRAIALALADLGAKVAVNDRTIDRAEETAQLVRSQNGKAQAYGASVDDPESVQGMLRDILADLGPISILVHNAGIPSRGQSVADSDPAEAAHLMNVHALAPFHVTQLVLPQMRMQTRGDIVFISSAATRLFTPRGAPYTMAKAAAEALALTLAQEERLHGIRTNIVAPALTVTDMGRKFAAARGVDISELNKESPFGRVSVPEDIAATIAFLVSDQNGYVNGQRIYVDGGG